MLFRNSKEKGSAKRGIDPRGFSFAPLFLFFSFLLSPSSFLHAETRIKTVEYNLGGYYSATNVNSGTKTSFPTRTIRLPESGLTIRSAWLEYEGITTAATNVSPLVLYFNAAATATTARFTSGAYTTQTGESIKLYARADVTAIVAAGTLATGQIFTGAVTITGPTTNSHNMKLHITYEYDDQSPIQVKTVRFPLYSNYAGKIAAYTAQRAAGTSAMQYQADIPDLSAIQQQWFEVRGFRGSGGSTNDASIYARIGALAVEPTMSLDGGLRDSYGFRYLTSSDFVAGFSTGTLQTVNLVTTRNTMSTLGGEVVITYEADNTAPVQLETVRYYLGQGSAANATALFSQPLYLREEGITVKEIYNRISGTFNSATVTNLPVTSKVNGTALAVNNYSVQSEATQISGYEFIHSLTGAAASWADGGVVETTVTANGSSGAHGAELVVTYTYDNDAAHTSYYQALAGLDTLGAGTTYATTVNLYAPEVSGSQTMRGAYIYANAISNAATANFTNTINFNGLAALTATQRSVTEATAISRFYQNLSQVTPNTASVTVNYSQSTIGTLGGQAGLTYTFVPVPKLPVSLDQTDGAAPIQAGIWRNSNFITFQGVLASSMNVDNLYLVAEAKANAAAFDGISLSTSGIFAYSMSPVTATMTVTGLVSGTMYKWRAAALGDGGLGGWVAFTAPSFGVDLSSPPAPAMATITPAANVQLNYSPTALAWENVADIDGSGLKNYEVQLATAADFTTLTFSSSPLAAAAAPSGLPEKPYFWRVRALDNAGNTGLWSSTRSFLVDLTAPTAVSNMGSGDQVWRNANNGLYDVTFGDTGGSLLKQVEVRVTSGPAQTGTEFAAWTPALTSINSGSYSAPWALPSGVWTLMQSWTTNYISVRVTDYSTNTYVLSDVFKVFKDTAAPAYTNGEAGGDLVWRKTGRDYNVDFADPYSKLAGVVYAARTTAGGSGAVLFSTTALAGISGVAYTADWALNFAGLAGDATNYITVEFYDIAGNTTTITDAFKVLKDTTPPSSINGEAGGDLAWRKTGRNYNFDFSDGGSGLNGAVYSARLASGGGGSMQVSTAAIAGVLGVSSAADWAVDFTGLAGDSTNYITVEFYDIAGNTNTVTDAFKVLKDTTPPAVPVPVSPADGYKTNNAALSFDWGDSSDNASGTLNYRLQLATAADFTTITYSSQPEVSAAFIPLAAQSTYYWRVLSSDTAGNYSDYSAYRSMLVDLSTPAITDGQAGDTRWRKVNDGLYNVAFNDAGGSLLSYFQIKVNSGPSQTGTVFYDWLTIAAGINSASYSAAWGLPTPVWDAIPSGTTGYVSVRVFDNVDNSSTSANDLFYVLKDTVPAVITDAQAGDDAWRNANPGSIYNVSFADDGGSKLDSLQYTAWTGPGRTGVKKIDWTFISSGPANISSYPGPWGISASSWPALAEGANYISVRAWDVAGTTTALDDVFYINKDTTAPYAQNNQAGGDAAWQKDPGKLYDVKFYDTGGALLNAIDYSVRSEPGGLGTLRKDWSPVVGAPLGAASYTAPWSVDFASLSEGAATNYISVRFTDLAGNTSTYADAFFISKDKTLPVIVDNQYGDDNWRNSSGTVYNLDFTDAGGSLVSDFELKITTGAAQSGTVIQDWAVQQGSINSASYTADWKLTQAQWNALPAGISYVSVRVNDGAANQQQKDDAFYILKDTSPPSIADNQAGDSNWLNANTASYNVDFADIGGSLLSKFQVRITTGPAQTGTLVADWTDAVSGINASSYGADWQLPDPVWNLLLSGTNYVSVRVMDYAGSTTALSDVFFVLKDTSIPVITDGQAGDAAWRRFGGTVYNVDFRDQDSGLAAVSYEAWDGPGKTGVNTVPLTGLSGATGAAYTTDWSVDFALLAQGTNYISVIAVDNLGQSSVLEDVFYVLKDNASPSITDNQAGDDIWRKTDPGAVYNVDFGDLTSGLTTAQYRITSLPGQAGTPLKEWTDIVSAPAGLASYAADWGVDFSAIPSGTTGYVSVRAYDKADNPAQVNDAFYVLKDTVVPNIVIVSTPAAGFGPYSSNPGAVFNIDFFDGGGSGINAPQYKVTTGQGGSGLLVKDWTNIATLAGATYYTQNWDADFYALELKPATNYFSVRATDLAGNTSSYLDSFKIFRSSHPIEVTATQTGDALWRTSNSGFYDVDFVSNEPGVDLSSFSAQGWTQPGRTGVLTADWTKIADTPGQSYSADWPLPQPFFDSLYGTTNYISIRAWNVAGASITLEDLFYVKKDTTPPSISDLQNGDNTWRSAAGSLYNIDFADLGSRLATAQYKITGQPAQAGALVKDWADIISNPAGQNSYTANWPVDFAALQSWTTGYVSVRAYDQAGLSAAVNDVFYVRKDTTPPTAADNQPDAAAFLSANTGLYNFDFADPGLESGLLKAQVRVSTHQADAPPYLLDWTDALALSGRTYSADWALPQAVWDEIPSGVTTYVSVRVTDAALLSSDTYNAFTVWKDTAAPEVLNNQTGDDAWRLADPGAVYDVDFKDLDSGAATAQYRLYAGPNNTGALLKDWTDIFSNSGGTALYAAPWGVDFAAAAEGENYVSVRVFDRAALSAAAQDVFYVRKDTTPPVIVNNQSGDYAWQSAPGAVYNVDFYDGASGLAATQYRVSTAPELGYPISDWQPVDLLTGYPAYYTDNWSVLFSTIAENATNYISVRAYDRLGLVSVSSDVFKVFKDVTQPSIADNQPGDDSWHNSSGTLYDVGFADAGGSLLDRFQVKLVSGPDQLGTVLADWTDVAAGMNSVSYSAAWALPAAVWTQLPEGQSYASSLVYDRAGNVRELSDTFYVRKDTTPPVIDNYQGGDAAWRAADTAVYDVRFADAGGSLLQQVKIKLTTGTGQAGTVLADWTPVLTGIDAASYTTPWPLTTGLWDAIQSGVTAYASVAALDNAGSTTTLADAFYVLKDTTAPTFTNGQAGDSAWRNANTGSYSVAFADAGGSLLSKVQVRASSGPAGTGAAAFGYTDNASGINSASYPGPWSLAAGLWQLLSPGTNYISARVYDNAGTYTDVTDAFYVLKDTQNPSGALSPPAYAGALGFNVAYSTADAGPAGAQYVKLYYTYSTQVPYAWTQFGGAFNASPIAFTAPSGGALGFRLVVYDKAGNKDEIDPPGTDTAPEAFTEADLTAPAAIDNEPGDNTWRNSAGTLYNVDFSAAGGSLLSAAQYKVTASPAQGGEVLKDWTDIAVNINAADHTADWEVDFAALKSSFNYVSVRAWNLAGTTGTVNDIFYIKKDTEAPSFTDNQPGDDNWRSVSPGAGYDVDFNDAFSLLSKAQYSASSVPGSAAGDLKPWTDIAAGISAQSYPADWGVDFSALVSGVTAYISARAYDLAGNVAVSTDVFYVLKDTVPPSMVNNQAGDNTWRAANTGVYNVDFADAGGSRLLSAQYNVWSAPGQAGTELVAWTDISPSLSGLSASAADWSISAGAFSLLQSGANYVSVRVADLAGSTVTLTDAFYVRKDVSGPAVTNNQTGDEAWRTGNTGLYNVDFTDLLSGLGSFEVKVTTGLNQSGTVLADWTQTGVLSGPASTADWLLPAAVFNAMQEGDNFVSVRGLDAVGNLAALSDAFYVKKDTSGPVIINGQAGDDVWRAANSGLYNVDLSDDKSLAAKLQAKAMSGPGQTGTLAFDWADAVTGINAASYMTDWALTQGQWDLLLPGTNYISIRAYDLGGSTSSLADAFYVRKDTVSAAAISPLAGVTGAEGAIALSWNAPSDSGEAAASYSVKVSSSIAIDAGNFDTADTYAQVWLPLAPGSPESYNLTGLEPDVLYYIAIKSLDRAGNLSGVSNTASAVTGPDATPPGGITDLGAQPGGFDGQVSLSWTAVGDNGLYIGTATAYQARYRTDAAITSGVLWDGANIYTQAWVPQYPGVTEAQSVDGLTAGVTYYWAVKAVDDANNTSAISNSTSAWAQVGGGTGGNIMYGVGTTNIPTVNTWAPPNFGTAQNGTATGALVTSLIRHVITRASPLRNEKLAGILSSDGVLQIQRYNGWTGTWTNEWSITDITAANSAYRGFDIAYEQNSGRAMVLYNSSTNGQLKYNIYDGNTWAGVQTLAAGSANAALWVRLEAKPGSNELMAALMNVSSERLTAAHWTGLVWDDVTVAPQTLGISTYQSFDIAWESLSGHCLLTYGGTTITGRANSMLWDGAAWAPFTASYFSFIGANGNANWLRLAADPNSDYIGATSLDSSRDWNAAIWDGNGWYPSATENGSTARNANQARTIDAAWEGKSGKFVIASAHRTLPTVLYAYWTQAGGWVTTLAGASTVGNWSNLVRGVQLEPDSKTNAMMLTAWSSSNDLRSAAWSGSVFTLDPTPHTTGLSANTYMPAMLAIHRHDIVPPTVTDNQPGDDVWRGSNAGVYNVDAADTGGSHLRGIQTKIYSGAGQAGALLQDWTTQVSTSGVDSYTQNWPLDAGTWSALKEGYNYITVRSTDGSDNVSLNPLVDAFYVKKDTTPPSVPVLSEPADGAFVKNPAVFFNWADSSDFSSGVNNYELQTATSADFTTPAYSAAPAVSESASTALDSAKYYWRVLAKDLAGNYSAYASTYAVLVDTVLPVTVNGQAGDDAWRNSSGTVYNIDFTDDGGSLLSGAAYAVYSAPGRTGSQLVSFAAGTVASGINASSYSTDWELSETSWALLANGTNYVSVQSSDRAGNLTVSDDVFYIRKDAAAPGITDNQAGDDAWRAAYPGAVYNVDFADAGGSLLDKFQLKIASGPGQTGTLLADWFDGADAINAAAYTADFGIGASTFAALPEGQAYISARAYDTAGNLTALSDVFYVRKDTSAPSAVAVVSPASGTITNNAALTLDWTDAADAGSGVYGYEVFVATSTDFAVLYSSAFQPVSQHARSVVSGLYFWRARALDNAGNYGAYSSTYSVRVDTAPPSVTDNQAGDDAWRSADPGAVYNVDFADAGGSHIESLEYSAWSGAGLTGVNAVPWTILTSTPLGADSYTSDWGAAFGLLGDGSNQVSVRVWDGAGSTVTVGDVFYVKKDAFAPGIADNQPGDDAWRAAPGALFNVDFNDTGASLLSRFQLKITAGPGQTGAVISDWFDRAPAINSASYSSDFDLGISTWLLLPSGTSYVSARVYDNAGNNTSQSDVFYVRKDTTAPIVTDGQAGDDAWRASNSGLYNIDFADAGGSELSYFQVKATTAAAQAGTVTADWTTVTAGLGSASYTADWALPQAVFDSLVSGINYISARVYDNAGLSVSQNDVFYVRKSTAAPRVVSNQAGDETWRNVPGTLYNVDFQDAGTFGLSAAQYKITTLPAQAGTLVKDWTYIASNIGAPSYTADWAVDFAALSENATNYVSVRAWDVSGATTTASDVFFVKKDVTAPSVLNNQAGDDTWRSANTGTYNVDFADAGGSGLERFEIKLTTGAGQTGLAVADWYATAAGLNSNSYTADWALAASTFTALPEGLGRVSVRVYDKAGNWAELGDAFYVKKDTTAPTAPAPLSPADLAPRVTLSPLFDWSDSSDGSSGVYGYALEVSTFSSGFSPLAYSASPTVSQQAGSLITGTTHYWRARALDNAGNYSGYSSTFRVVVDTVAPAITDGQPAETSWRSADPGAVYNVDFADNLTGLDTMEYSAWTGPGATGSNTLGWTLISSGAPRLAYTANWGVNFSLLAAGTNYISARAWDVAGSTSARNDVFNVLKDTSGPEVLDNQSGDDAWRAANPGAVYDVDFRDLYSGVATLQYRITSLPAQGGAEIVPWSDLTSGLGVPSYSANWGLSGANWTLLAQGTNYVTVRAFDKLAQASTLADAFYIRKDTTAPTVTDNQTDIALAQSQAEVDAMNVDFADTGGSLLSRAQYSAWTGPGRTGGEVIAWTDIASAINAASYTADWPVNYLALPNLAVTYVSVRAYDSAGSITYYNDAFSVYKEGSGPSIINNQSGDNTWRGANDGVYDVDFQSESGYNLDYFQVTASTSQASPAYLVAWTSAAWSIGSTIYSAGWALPQAVFDALAPGRNYVSLRVYDQQPGFSVLNNAFYVQKDTSAPSLALTQAGDDAWQGAAGKTYNVDFFDALSGLATAQYRITSQPAQAGTLLKDWTDIASPGGAASYTADWPVDFEALEEWATGYVTVRAFDALAQSSAAADAFYIRKDTTPPSVPAAVAPADLAAYSTATVLFDWADAADSRSGVAGYALETSVYQDFSAVYASSFTAVSQASLNNIPDGNYYWRAAAFDRAGNYSAYAATRAFTVDTSSPLIVNNQASPTAWLAANPGAVFDVDFRDLASGVTTVQYRVSSAASGGGALLKDWTDVLSSTGTLYSPADWSLDFAALGEGANYISVRAFDRVALSSTALDAFVVRKDTSAPAITDSQAGDDTWRRASGAVYNVDFADLGAGLATGQYRITSLPAQGGTVLKDWTNIFTAAGAASYTADWPVDFFALAETATNYISVRAYDTLGGSRTLEDVFYALKDVTNPAIQDNQPDENVWRSADPGPVYNVGFTDLGGAKLDRFQTRITSGAAGTGTLILDWTDRVLAINATYYSQLWAPDFNSLGEGFNYVSVRVYDYTGNSAQQADVYSVRKDTTPPTVIDNQAGDDAWRSANTGTYNVDFADAGGAGMDYFQVRATTDAAGAGTPVFDWTSLVTGINAQSYTADWQLTAQMWNLLQSGTYYISVRAWDAAGSSSATAGAFYIRKDTQTVSVTDNQGGDNAWRSMNNGLYDIDAAAPGGSPLDRFEVRSSTLPGNLGPFTSDWTPALTGLGVYTYTADWGLPAAVFNAMLSGYVNYVSVRVYNQAGFYAELADGFYVRKDTVTPQVINNIPGGDLNWRNGPGTLYDLDLADAGGSLLSGLELRASTSAAAGPYLFDWTVIQAGINSGSYTNDFAVPASSFSLLAESVTNYISVRAYDVAGNTVTVTDAFLVLKDTTPPAVTDNQAGDSSWRRSSGTVYNIDFTDAGGSGLSKIQVRASPNAGTLGPWYFDWSDAVTGIDSTAYGADWPLPQALWNLLGEGTNYISVQVWDNAGSTATFGFQPFFIIKDTTTPFFVNGEAGGDAAWRNSGRDYDLDLNDAMSGLAALEYSASTTPVSADGGVKAWTSIAAGAGLSYTADWPLDFTALKEGVTNYISVRAWDLAGSTYALSDAFYVKKDTTPPTAYDYQAGESAWRNSNGGSYDIDFADTGNSLISKFQLKASTGRHRYTGAGLDR